MKRFATGLVVGKFCPLHRGHQYLLDQALAQCAKLVVISYTKPEMEGCGPDRRERWLSQLYPDCIRLVLDDARLAEHTRRKGLAPAMVPDNDAQADVHREFVALLLDKVLRVEVNAVFTSETYGDGFARVLDRAQRVRGGPPVVHVPVDPGRGVVPVSGTAIRADIRRARHWLDPIVYRDFA